MPMSRFDFLVILLTFVQLSEDESEFPATSAENSRFAKNKHLRRANHLIHDLNRSSLPHTTPESGAARMRKRKNEEKTPQKSPPKVDRAAMAFCYDQCEVL